jgi:predicted metal-dependent hydrolase
MIVNSTYQKKADNIGKDKGYHMIEFIVITTLILILSILFSKVHSSLTDDRITVKGIDGRYYKVRNTSKKQETADTLARLNKKVLDFIQRLVVNSESDYKAMALRLSDRYNPDALSEGRIDKRFTSYTVNKGEQVVLCVRSRDAKDQIYDDNLIFYVTLHELAHIASITEDHSPEFHKNFRYLLRKASEWDLWQKVNEPFQYCGLDVNGM